MKIAVCDDNERDTARLAGLLKEYNSSCCEVSFTCFCNALDLLDSLQKNDFDVVFLDVLMPVINGIDAAKEIRKTNSRIMIVLLTSSPEFAIAGYSVKACSYLLKPCGKTQLFELLDNMLQTLKQPDEFIIVKARAGIIKIFYSQIVFLEVSGKTVAFHLADKTVCSAAASLGKFEALLLSRKEFCRIHRSYIVNLNFIKELSARSLTCLCETAIPVSRRLHSEVREKYINYIFSENGV